MIGKIFLIFQLTSLVLGLHHVITKDGCPPITDDNTYGIVYKKPEFCTTLLPTHNNLTEFPEVSQTPFVIKLYYTRFLDTFRVVIMSTDETKMHDVWLTTNRIGRDGRHKHPVGHFDARLNVDFYCCYWTQTKTVARKTVSKRIRPFQKAIFTWTPLNFIGRFLFRANIIIGDGKWYSNVTSQVFIMPPGIPKFLQSRGNETIRYWQEKSSGETDEFYYSDDK